MLVCPDGSKLYLPDVYFFTEAVEDLSVVNIELVSSRGRFFQAGSIKVFSETLDSKATLSSMKAIEIFFLD